MGVGIVFRFIVMGIAGVWDFGCQTLKPVFKISAKPRFIIVDKDAGSRVHRIDETEPLADGALLKTGLNLRGDIENPPAAGNFEPEFMAETFHGCDV